MKPFRINITFKRGNRVVTKIIGQVDLDPGAVSIEEMRRLVETEGLIERFTGLRVHVEQEETS